MSMTKFYSGLDASEPVVLVHGVSLDNPKQNDAEYRQEFVKLLQSHQKRIAHCIELLGDEIYGLYSSEQQAQLLTKQWQQHYHQNDISTLWFWQKLSSHDDYQSLVQSIEDDYQYDKIFKNIVDDYAQKYAHKKDKSAAYQYVIQECAGFLILPKIIQQSLKLKDSTPIVVTYPAKEFNAAISYQLKKHHSELQYKGYYLHLPEKELLIKQCLKLKNELISHNITDESQQTAFVKEVFHLVHQYQTKESFHHEKNQFPNGFFKQ